MAALSSRWSLLRPKQSLREDQLQGSGPQHRLTPPAPYSRAYLVGSTSTTPRVLRSAAGTGRGPRRHGAFETGPNRRGVNVGSVAQSVPGQAETDGAPQERKQGLKLKVLPRLKPRPVQYMCVTREAHSFLCVPWPRTIVQRTVAGLDRGVAASEEEVQRVLQAVEALEAEASLRSFQEGPPLPGTPSSSTSSSSSDEGPYGLEAMQGLWRLVFSSGFAAGSLGGLRPGPPTGRLPILVGQVLQRIDMDTRTLDNIVELRLGVLPWPLPSVEVTATLAHTFEVLGTSTFRITFEKTSVKTGDFSSTSPLPSLSTPEIPDFLRPPSPARSGQFETTYLDTDFRVSRGDLGELRIFVRA